MATVEGTGFWFETRNIAVGIVTGLLAGRFGARFLTGRAFFPLLQNVQVDFKCDIPVVLGNNYYEIGRV
jgi:hypothetical protein